MHAYKIKDILFLVCSNFLGILSCFAQPVSFTSQIKKLSDISMLPAYTNNSVVKQISSYDRTGGNDDGFSGKYSYLRKEKNGLVIFDAKEPGVIERIWTPTPTDDTLDFYFDGNNKPELSISFRDLFTGKIYPFIKPLVAHHLVGGYYSYVPIPYSKSCKIIFRGEKILFHQIQYREFKPSALVKTFSKNLSENEKAELEKTKRLWSTNEHVIDELTKKAYKTQQSTFTIKPGDIISFADLKIGGRLLGFEILPSVAFEGMLKDLVLKINWDNEPAPAVYAPLADFFGYAFGRMGTTSLLLGATPSKAYCFIPMPFDSSAKLELVYNQYNKDALPIEFTARVFYTNEKRNALKEGRFYAYWNNDFPLNGQSHIFLKGNGSGHYIGTLLQSQATEFAHFTEFFEGDDKTIIDGEMTTHGTGSEDYFNGGWYAQPGGWVEKLGGPVSGCMDYSLPASRTAGYRFFIGDKMPFNKSIEHTIEHGPTNNRDVNYISVAMYYANKPVAVNESPSEANHKVFQPNTYSFYTRLMKHLSYNGALQFKNDQAQLVGKDAGVLIINVNEIPKGRYKLFIHKTNSGGLDFDVKVSDEREVSDWRHIKLDAKSAPEIYLGDVEVADFYVPLSVIFKTEIPLLRFDRVMLVK